MDCVVTLFIHCQLTHRNIKSIYNINIKKKYFYLYFRDAYHHLRTRLSMCQWRQPTHVVRKNQWNFASKRVCKTSHAKNANEETTQPPISPTTITMTMPHGGSPTPCLKALGIPVRSISPCTWVCYSLIFDMIKMHSSISIILRLKDI